MLHREGQGGSIVRGRAGRRSWFQNKKTTISTEASSCLLLPKHKGHGEVTSICVYISKVAWEHLDAAIRDSRWAGQDALGPLALSLHVRLLYGHSEGRLTSDRGSDVAALFCGRELNYVCIFSLWWWEQGGVTRKRWRCNILIMNMFKCEEKSALQGWNMTEGEEPKSFHAVEQSQKTVMW